MFVVANIFFFFPRSARYDIDSHFAEILDLKNQARMPGEDFKM